MRAGGLFSGGVRLEVNMNPENINKYLYIEKTPTWLIRMVYGLGLLTWVAILYGYISFYFINPVFFLIISPIILFLFIYHFVSYSIMLCYKQFDLPGHKQLVATYVVTALSKSKNDFPVVDIFLPICGEDTAVIQSTFDAVSKLQYSAYNVYVLDDRGDSEHRSLAHHYNFIYMSRENRGEMKKAGNLKHGFERSSGEFIVVFDADFAPHPDFINETLPYMRDPQVGIVQTPQYFETNRTVHQASALQYGAAHVQEDFYRFIQVARSRLGAPICCGSNALYRRSALDTIGGTVQIEHSEDAYTGFELTNQGYRVLFIPVILAIGLCPDNFHAYFHQQHRWCSGSLSMMLNKRFWTSRLSLVQKICFTSGFMYYLSHPVTLLLSFQTFFVLFFYSDTLNFMNALPFLPAIAFSFVLIPMIRITRMRFGGFLARNAYLYAYTHATILAFMRQSVVWQPTNTKRSDVSKQYLEQLQFISVYFLLYLTLFAFSVGAGTINLSNVQSYSLLFWIFYTGTSTAIILVYLYLLMDEIKTKKVTTFVERLRHQVWRLKTGGVYLSVLLCAAASADWYGANVNSPQNFLLGEVMSVEAAATPLVVAEVPMPERIPANTTKITTATEGQKAYVFTRELMLGSVGPDVVALQKFLNQRGYPVAQSGSGAANNETDYFGPKTAAALRVFQFSYKIPETGVLTSRTRLLISSIAK